MAIERKNYITPGGFKLLNDEHDFLKKLERPRVTQTVSWAASLGDRSENADYQYAKKRLREIDRRLRFLTKRINEALVVDPLEQRSLAITKVMFGAKVTLEDSEGDQRVYVVVGVDEINIAKGHISWKSPVARGLIGKDVGDEITIKSPSGLREYVISKVVYEVIEV